MMLGALHFARPEWLIAGLPLALLLWRHWRSPMATASVWANVVDAHLLPHLLAAPSGQQPGRRRLRLALAAMLTILALAGPRLGNAPGGNDRLGATRLLVVDLSGTTDDGKPLDLDRLRLKLRDLLSAMPPGETGLIAYAGEPYLIVPPTHDPASLARFVPELASDALPVPGNRPDYALAMARQILARSPSGAGDIVWITANAARFPRTEALPSGIRLTLLDAAAPLPGGAAAPVVPNAGRYLRMSDDHTDIVALTDFLTSSTAANAGEGPPQAGDLGYWLILPLLLLLAPDIRHGRLATLVLPAALACLLAPAPADARDWQWPDLLANRQGLRQLQAGDAEQASRQFRDPRWRGVAHYRQGQYAAAAEDWAAYDDADAHYNRGNALARQGKLPEALDAYNRSLALRPKDADTRHNRDLVERLLRQGNSPSPGAVGQPPPPQARTPKPAAAPSEQDAAQLAEQWLRQVHDDPGNLLRRKLQLEHQRRQVGTAANPW